jgi:hypothetical protein
LPDERVHVHFLKDVLAVVLYGSHEAVVVDLSHHFQAVLSQQLAFLLHGIGYASMQNS